MAAKKQVKPHYNVSMGDSGCLSLGVVIPMTEASLKELMAKCQEQLDYLEQTRQWAKEAEERRKAERIKIKTKTPQFQFLGGIAEYGRDSRGEYVDIYLSDYNLAKVKKISPLSPLRWVNGINLALAPGSGSGRVCIGDYSFKVTYAWGGRSWPTDSSRRSCYTVRLFEPNIWDKFKKLGAMINQHECKGSGGCYIARIETDYLK